MMKTAPPADSLDLEAYLASSLDDLIARGVVNLVTGAGALAGTGFFITPRVILTCHHVVQHGVTLEVRAADGTLLPVEDIVAGVSLQLDNDEIDLSLVDLAPGTEGHTWLPLPIALEDGGGPSLVGRAGADPGTGYVGSSPFELRVVGRAKVRHRSGSGAVDALDLDGTGVRPGSSGAPLFDTAWRGVVAVIVGGNPERDVRRSWAVPISEVRSWQAVADAIDWNRRFVPCFGAAINEVGARALFDVHKNAVREGLVRDERFDDRLDVPRALAHESIEAFLASSSALLAVVGPSNVGKSWMLAAFLLQSPGGAASNTVRVLFEARAIPRGTPSLADLLCERLSDAAGRRYAGLRDRKTVPDVRVLLEALRAADTQLIVIVDGLNEAPDGDWFASQWLREAAGWAREERVRLILSCRTESWPIIAETANFSAALFHLPQTQLPAGDGSGTRPALAGPAEWCHTLSDFSPSESTLATQRYGFGEYSPIGPHPLLYRLARTLEEQQTGNLGLFRVLERYVQKQLARVCSALGRAAAFRQQLRAKLTQLADQLPPSGEGGVTLEHAIAIVGEASLLDKLVDEGLLSMAADHVRFRFDQLADALRTVPPDALAGFSREFAEGEDLAKLEARLASASIALLRFEASGDKLYQTGLSALLTAFERDHAPAELCEYAERVARALPPARSDDILQIYEAIARLPRFWAGRFRSLAEAPVAVSVRIGWLLRCAHLQPYESTGYPLRWKDWADADRRSSFVAALSGFGSSREVQAPLWMLLQSFPDDARPALVEALDDETRIGSEASVASLSAGLLFLDAERAFSWLFGALLLRYLESNSRRTLLGELVDEYGALARSEIFGRLEEGDRSAGLVYTLCWLPEVREGDAAAELIEQLFAESMQPGSPIAETASTLASVVRRRDPGNLLAWDVLVERWRGVGSVPSERLEQTLEKIRVHGVDFARAVLSDDESAAEMQRQFADALRESARTRPRESWGLFLEGRLDRFDRLGRIPERDVWLALAREVAADPGNPGRETLSFCAFHTKGRSPWTLSLREFFLRNPASEDDMQELLHQLVHSDEGRDDWLHWVKLARARDATRADAHLWEELARWARYDDQAVTRAQDLVHFWRNEHIGTSTAAAVLSRLDNAASLKEVLAVK